MGSDDPVDVSLDERFMKAVGFVLRFSDHCIPAAYIIEHSRTGLMYVGSTGNLYHRPSQHRSSLKLGRHRSKELQKAFDEDPKFSLRYIPASSREKAYAIEQIYLDRLSGSKFLVNIAKDAKLNAKGVSRSPEHRKKMSVGLRKYFAVSENKLEFGKAISAGLNKPVSKALKSKITKELWANPAYRAKLEGRKFSSDSRKKLSEAKVISWQNPDYRAKIQDVHKKSITINGMYFSSHKEAADYFGIKYKTFHKRTVEGYSGWVIEK